MNTISRSIEIINGVETEYLRILYYDFNSLYTCQYHSYEFTRLCTVLSGAKKVQVNNCKSFISDNSEFIILPPYSSVMLEIEVPTKALVIEIFSNLIEDIIKKVSFETNIKEIDIIENNFLHPQKTPKVEIILENIIHAVNGVDKNKEFLINLYAQELAYNLLKDHYIQRMYGTENFVYLSIQMMKDNLLEGISIGDIADSLHMSLGNFSLKFKQTTGISPNKYLTSLKLAYAENQIQLQNRNISEIAWELGYQNISHFISLFKERFGVTPKQYIKQTCR